MQDGQTAGALERQLRVGVAGVADPSSNLVVAANPIKVRFAAGRVDAQEIVLLLHPMNEQIIHQSPSFIHQPGILRLVDPEAGDIIAGKLLQQGQGDCSLDLNFSHVAHIEEADARPHRHVLGNNAAVFQRHIPPPELDHAGAHLAVGLVQSGFSQRNRFRGNVWQACASKKRGKVS